MTPKLTLTAFLHSGKGLDTEEIAKAAPVSGELQLMLGLALLKRISKFNRMSGTLGKLQS